MSEIKPVYQVQQLGEWIEVDKSIFDELYIQNKFPHRILYPATEYEALKEKNERLETMFKQHLCSSRNLLQKYCSQNAAQAKRIAELEEALQFVERWANHHGTKPNVTAQEALSCIQHYPSIAAITKSYKEGVIPVTRNPYAEIESLRKQVEELSQPIPDWKIELLFNRAIDYRELRISEAAYYKAVREILSASKNGE